MSDFTRPEDVRRVYQRRAGHYDAAAGLYKLIRFDLEEYRRQAVAALNLKAGDTVVDIGCGTGLNFRLLQEGVGPDGRIIGVDLTPEMLRQAERRIETNGWHNVELVESRAAGFTFPPDVDAILSTYALTLEPEYDRVVGAGADALRPGGRWAILDFKMPSGWSRVFAPMLIALSRPFAVSGALAVRRPWESLERHLEGVDMREFYFGYAYLAVGTRAATPVPSVPPVERRDTLLRLES